jgi:nitrite reductase/ring-hydroxylating ferredoxin subunit
VALYSDLASEEGKYFIDFDMNPAMAFVQANGLPLVLSAKCTHLGCTVGNRVDAQGRVLCPCHISYFDIKTGTPNAGAPATQPLPRLGWILKNPQDEIVASASTSGAPKGVTDPAALQGCKLYVARPASENA